LVILIKLYGGILPNCFCGYEKKKKEIVVVANLTNIVDRKRVPEASR